MRCLTGNVYLDSMHIKQCVNKGIFNAVQSASPLSPFFFKILSFRRLKIFLISFRGSDNGFSD